MKLIMAFIRIVIKITLAAFLKLVITLECNICILSCLFDYEKGPHDVSLTIGFINCLTIAVTWFIIFIKLQI